MGAARVGISITLLFEGGVVGVGFGVLVCGFAAGVWVEVVGLVAGFLIDGSLLI